MIIEVILTSLQIVFIHVLFWDGMILDKVRLWYLRFLQNTRDLQQLNSGILNLEKRKHFLSTETKGMVSLVLVAAWIVHHVFSFLKKPLFDCLICMTSIWGTLFYFLEWHHSINFIWFILSVGGITAIIYGVIGNAEDFNGEKFVSENAQVSIPDATDMLQP